MRTESYRDLMLENRQTGSDVGCVTGILSLFSKYDLVCFRIK